MYKYEVVEVCTAQGCNRITIFLKSKKNVGNEFNVRVPRPVEPLDQQQKMLAAGTMMDAAKILPSLLRDSDSEFGAALCVINRLVNDHGKYTVPEAQCVLRCAV